MGHESILHLDGIPLPPNLTIEDVEFLSSYNGNLVIPPQIGQLIELYRRTRLQYQATQKTMEIEGKVKQICYDMMIGVL